MPRKKNAKSKVERSRGWERGAASAWRSRSSCSLKKEKGRGGGGELHAVLDGLARGVLSVTVAALLQSGRGWTRRGGDGVRP
jgi:hypothetical protein